MPDPKHLSTHPTYAEAAKLDAEATERLSAAAAELQSAEGQLLTARPGGLTVPDDASPIERARILMSDDSKDWSEQVEHVARLRETVRRLRLARDETARAKVDAEMEFAALVRADELPLMVKRGAAVRAVLADCLKRLEELNAADVEARKRIDHDYGLNTVDAVSSLAVETGDLSRLIASIDGVLRVAQRQVRAPGKAGRRQDATAQARVLSDIPTIGARCGDLLKAPADLVDELAEERQVDTHPEAIRHAQQSGARVVFAS